MESSLENLYNLRKIEREDNPSVQKIIETVMPEFHACGKGFALEDPEVKQMYEAYQGPGKIYFVIESEGKILGGGGVMALKCGEPGTCELQKMYFLREARGKGWGKKLLTQLIQDAKAMGYKKMYLETLTGMDQARSLYLSFGFKKIEKAQGDTGHFMCDTYYVRDL